MFWGCFRCILGVSSICFCGRFGDVLGVFWCRFGVVFVCLVDGRVDIKDMRNCQREKAHRSMTIATPTSSSFRLGQRPRLPKSVAALRLAILTA